jgi:predicted membrane protein
MLIIAIGFTLLFERHKRGGAIVLLLIGIFLLLPKFNVYGMEFIKGNALSVILIVAGVIFLLHILFGYRRHGHCCHRHYHHSGGNNCRHHGIFVAEDGNGDFIDYVCVFFNGTREVDTCNFKGGKIHCVMGNFEIDLTKARLSEGNNVLELNTVFGCTILYIPADWNIKIAISTAFGTVEDKRLKNIIHTDAAGTLTICGSVVFGYAEIRDSKISQPFQDTYSREG